MAEERERGGEGGQHCLKEGGVALEAASSSSSS